MKFDPRKIPHDLVERAAMAMQGADDIRVPWASLTEAEQGRWLYLAKAALVGVSIHVAGWPLLPPKT